MLKRKVSLACSGHVDGGLMKEWGVPSEKKELTGEWLLVQGERMEKWRSYHRKHWEGTFMSSYEFKLTTKTCWAHK